MLNKIAFANSLAVMAGMIYIIFYAIAWVSPSLFPMIFDAQFLGAAVSDLVPDITFNAVVAGVLIVAVTAWVAGFLWAVLYNMMANGMTKE